MDKIEFEEELRKLIGYKITIGNDNSIFPEFLFKPITTDLAVEDSYFEIVNDELLHRIKNVRRRYNNPYKYLDSMDIYDEYMEGIYEKYGNKKVLARCIKHGYVREYIPDQPKLRKNKSNNAIIKHGIIPSREITPFDPDVLPQTQNSKSDNIEMVNYTELKDMPKYLKRAIKESDQRLIVNSRRKSLYNTGHNNPGFDIITEIMNDLYNTSVGKAGNIETTGLADRYKAYDKALNQTEIDRYHDEMETSVIVNGVYRKKKDMELVELYKSLNDMGFDVAANLKSSGMKKESIRMITNKIGIMKNGPATKKDKKKFAKKAKQEQQRMTNKRKGNDILNDMLLNNRVVNFDDDDDGLMSFTYDSLH